MGCGGKTRHGPAVAHSFGAALGHPAKLITHIHQHSNVISTKHCKAMARLMPLSPRSLKDNTGESSCDRYHKGRSIIDARDDPLAYLRYYAQRSPNRPIVFRAALSVSPGCGFASASISLPMLLPTDLYPSLATLLRNDESGER